MEDKNMGKKTLYFEGAGCVPYNDVENCRIRTAFTNKEGKKIYIEMLCGHTYKKPSDKISSFNWLSCTDCYYITDNPEVDDCNFSRLPCERSLKPGEIEYTKENILAFVNENCNADFDEIIILDNLAGFRVHNSEGKYNTPEQYNYGDIFNYDADLTRRRREKVEEMKKEFCALFNQKYDNTSYYIENNNLIARICVSDRVLKESGWTKDRKFIVEV